MPYSATALRRLRGPVANVAVDGPNIWIYESADTIATIGGANYFTGEGTTGRDEMKVNDLVIADGNDVRECGYVSEITGTAASVTFPVSIASPVAFPATGR